MKAKVLTCILTCVTCFIYAQNVYYVNDDGTGTGASWGNELPSISSALEKAIIDNSTNTIIYVKEGTYTNEYQVDGVGEGSLPAGDILIKGGFPDNALNVDLCGYNPVDHIVDIVYQEGLNSNPTYGASLYTIDKATGPANLTLTALKFSGTNETDYVLGTIVSTINTSPALSAASTYRFQDLIILDQKADAFSFGHNSNGVADTYLFKDCFFKDNQVDSPILFRATVDDAIINVDGGDFMNNQAFSGRTGGAIRILGQNLTVAIKDASFCSNTSNEGGAISIASRNPGDVGAVYDSNNTVTIENCDFYGNNSNLGGALFLYHQKEVSIIDSHFEINNSTTTKGGGIFCQGDANSPNLLSLTGNVFSQNVSGRGGGVYALYTQIQGVDNFYDRNTANKTVDENTFAKGGGAIVIDGTDVSGTETNNTINGDIYKGNESTISGGAMYLLHTALTISNADFGFNKATGQGKGGAIHLDYAKLTIDTTTLYKNYATVGGAIFSTSGTLYLNDNKFLSNQAISTGGAIRTIGTLNTYPGGPADPGTPDFVFTGNKFHGNSIDFSIFGLVREGGALYIEGTNAERSQNLIMMDNEFLNNSAYSSGVGKGGAMTLLRSNAEIFDCRFQGNTANQGGALFLSLSSIYIKGTSPMRSYFRNNQAQDTGGAIRGLSSSGYTYNLGQTIENVSSYGMAIKNTEFYNNSTASLAPETFEAYGGGAIFSEGFTIGIYGSSFIDNAAKVSVPGFDIGGGAISANLKMRVSNSQFSGNTINGRDDRDDNQGASDITARCCNDQRYYFIETKMQLPELSYPNFSISDVDMEYGTTGLQPQSSLLSEMQYTFPNPETRDPFCPQSAQQSLVVEKAVAIPSCGATSASIEVHFLDRKADDGSIAPDAPYTYEILSPTGARYTQTGVNKLKHTFNNLTESGRYSVAVEDVKGCIYKTFVDVTCRSLPVELSHFELVGNACEVNLSWKTDSEENFSHYEIEWSTDAVNFQTIGVVNSSGSSEGAWYNMNAESVVKENYYRLKMVDLDETYEYSKIEYIQTDCENDGAIVYPNPVMDVANIRFFALNEDTEIILSDIFGNEMRRLKLSVEPATWNNLTMDMTDFNAGTYLLRIDGGGRSYSRVKKIIVANY